MRLKSRPVSIRVDGNGKEIGPSKKRNPEPENKSFPPILKRAISNRGEAYMVIPVYEMSLVVSGLFRFRPRDLRRLG